MTRLEANRSIGGAALDRRFRPRLGFTYLSNKMFISNWIDEKGGCQVRIKLLTTALVAGLAAWALPAGAMAEGGPTIKYSEWGEAVQVEEPIRAFSSDLKFETAGGSSFGPGTIHCKYNELSGTLAFNEGPAIVALGESLFRDAPPPNSPACATTIPALPGQFFRAVVASNVALEGWELEFFDDGTGELRGEPVEFSALMEFLYMGTWYKFAKCPFTTSSLEFTYEEANTPLDIAIPNQEVEAGGPGCPTEATISGNFVLTSSEQPLEVTSP